MNGIIDCTDEADNATKGKLCTFVYHCSHVHFLLIASALPFNSEKGVPNFWLTAMKTNQTLDELVRGFMYLCFLQFPFVIMVINNYVLFHFPSIRSLKMMRNH